MNFLPLLVVSALAVFATACNLWLVTHLHATRKKAGVEIGTSLAIFILSYLSLCFSIEEDAAAMDVILSLGDVALVIYQVGFLVCFLAFTNLMFFKVGMAVGTLS